MSVRQVLFSTVAAIAIAATAVAAPAPAGAQEAAVAIDKDDIGGVVHRPERAGGRRLGHRGDDGAADEVRQDRRHRRPGSLRHPGPAERELPGLGARLRPRRLAEDAGEARRADSITRPCRRPTRASAAQYYPAIYWYAMMQMPPAKDFGGTTDIPKEITRELWRQRMGNVDCIGCHQLGQELTRTHPGAAR